MEVETKAGDESGRDGRRPGRARRWVGILALGVLLAVLAAIESRVRIGAGSKGPRNAASAFPAEIEAAGAFTHPASGFEMPETAGPFVRLRVVQYDAAGRDVGAGYRALLGDGTPLRVEATVFVYPKLPGDHVDGAFARAIHAIEEGHSGAQPELREGLVLSPRRFRARFAAFTYDEPWAGGAEPVALGSCLVLYEWKGWWVKWRFTTPMPIDEAKAAAIAGLAETLLPPEDEPRTTDEPQTKEVE